MGHMHMFSLSCSSVCYILPLRLHAHSSDSNRSRFRSPLLSSLCLSDSTPPLFLSLTPPLCSLRPIRTSSLYRPHCTKEDIIYVLLFSLYSPNHIFKILPSSLLIATLKPPPSIKCPSTVCALSTIYIFFPEIS